MGLSLDIRTIFAALAVAMTCLAAALCFISATQKTYPGFKQWTLGAVAMALGYLLFLLRGPLPEAIPILAGNTLFVAGSALTFAGTRGFLGLKPWPKFQTAVPLACLAGLAWFLWGYELIGMRGLLLSLSAALLLFPTAWMLGAHAPPGQRPLYLGTGITFALFCTALLIRGVGMMAQGPNFQLFAQSPLQAGFFLFLLMSQVSWIIGLLLINQQRMSDDLRQSRAELAVSAEKLARILAFLPDPTWVVDRTGRVTHWNQAMERLTGVPAARMLGKGDCEHALPLYGQRRPCLIDLVLRRRPEGEKLYPHLEERGEVLTLAESFLPPLGQGGIYVASSATRLLDDQGQVAGAIATLRDITEAKRSQQEREKLITELTEALDKVKTLKGLIPICSHCKSIRRDEGYWQQLEAFFSDHAEVEFSHGICPDCLEKYYQEFKQPPDSLGKGDDPDDVG